VRSNINLNVKVHEFQEVIQLYIRKKKTPAHAKKYRCHCILVSQQYR